MDYFYIKAQMKNDTNHGPHPMNKQNEVNKRGEVPLLSAGK